MLVSGPGEKHPFEFPLLSQFFFCGRITFLAVAKKVVRRITAHTQATWRNKKPSTGDHLLFFCYLFGKIFTPRRSTGPKALDQDFNPKSRENVDR